MHETPGAGLAPGVLASRLLDGDGGAGGLELALSLLGGLLGALLQHRLGRAVDQVLGLLEAQARDDLTHNLDDADLLVAGGLEDDVECGLLFGRRGRRAAGGGPSRGYGDRGGRDDLEGLLELLHELREL